MESVTLDQVDHGLVHALRLDGRASFARIGEVLGVSENTVARRYRRLRSAGLLRVTGGVDGARLGYQSWTVRLRCTPDAGVALATALARRPDTYWVHLLSGGTEISCFTQARSTDELLLDKLPRTGRLLSMTAQSILRGFALPSGWPGGSPFTGEQIARLKPADPEPGDRPVVLTGGDHALLGILAKDGRTGYNELAAATGWSESTAKRRVEQLRGLGVLVYEVEISAGTLGYQAEARLWMSMRPAGLVAAATELASHPEVTFAAVTTGPTNLLAAVACRTTAELYAYLTERVAALNDVHTLETAPVLRTVKRSGAILPR
ncbi:Lrp/AsnC family transcriptional regulator [Amycolatopsis sp. H20-H5]|uniref:Lrp/AsnC family transcriptional regulator n=1 Tax=Amycolatopsis sp. H20-H5 TaxID=3046309 RepID=UPI002DBFC27A|nr:Lrp/AsnC family transcriptional regulator [Amycolatopsis sp. H20-H5]MEC3982517.1 Lrp/AsnC family transcriptional regulator [Amycolatopsis sp. H20-H5]